MGFVTDHANEVIPGAPTPAAKMIELMGGSSAILADVLRVALPAVAVTSTPAAGTVYRFEQA
jgi:hypothetical protein